MGTCRKCKRTVHQIGGYLTRVNETGVEGIWECRPSCEADLPAETRLMLALDDDEDTTPWPPHQASFSRSGWKP